MFIVVSLEILLSSFTNLFMLITKSTACIALKGNLYINVQIIMYCYHKVMKQANKKKKNTEQNMFVVFQ